MRNEQEYIYMIYQKGSFSKAAQALCLTQPALSIAVQKLENEIGMPLFDRAQKPIGLTEAGQIYIQNLQRQLALEEELKNRLLDLTAMKSGSVRIGATSYILSCILPSVLFRYKNMYPGVRLDITEAGSYELREKLMDQKLDLIFMSRLDKNMPYTAHPGFVDRLLLAVPAAFPVNRQLHSCAMSSADILAGYHLREDFPTVDLAVFADTPFIVLDKKYDLRQRAEALFSASGIHPPIIMETAQVITAQVLSNAGIGATFLPDRAVRSVNHETLYYKMDSPHTVRHMHMVTNNNSYTPLAVQRFMDMFSEIG